MNQLSEEDEDKITVSEATGEEIGDQGAIQGDQTTEIDAMTAKIEISIKIEANFEIIEVKEAEETVISMTMDRIMDDETGTTNKTRKMDLSSTM